MKSRIIPAIPETVLSYNIGDKAALLENAASRLGMKHMAVPADKAGEPLGFIAGYNGFLSNGSSVSADGECVIFSGISSKRLDALLKEMRAEGLDIPLKAVITPHNQSMSIERLLTELEREHEAVTRSLSRNKK